MAVTLLVNASLAAALPGAVAVNALALARLEAELVASAKLSLDLQVELPDLKASLDIALQLSADLKASLSIDPGLTIAASLSYAADAQLALAAGLSAPSLSLGISAQLDAQLQVAADLSAKASVKADLLADVTARIELLKVAIAAAAAFGTSLAGAAGVRLYLFTGSLDQLSAELEAQFATAEGRAGVDAHAPVFVPILVTDNAASFNGMKAVFALE